MMWEIACGIILGFAGLSLINLILGGIALSFGSEDGREFWAIMGVVAVCFVLAQCGTAGAVIGLVLLFGFLCRKRLFGGAEPVFQRRGPALDLKPIKTDRKGRRL